MPESHEQSVAPNMISDLAPKLVSLTDDVLFGDIWERPELAPRDRSLITVAALIAALIAGGHTAQLPNRRGNWKLDWALLHGIRYRRTDVRRRILGRSIAPRGNDYLCKADNSGMNSVTSRRV